MFLTAKTMTEDKIKGFRAGADDYLTKPFSTDELLLRITAILRRTNSSTESDLNTFDLGSFTYDVANYTLSHQQGDKKLTKKEAEILKILCEHKDKVIERELVLNLVWGDDSYFNGRSLDVFITKLRKYLKADETVKITNIHGVGFKLEC
jgi:DNA-binding response OmpR family regulator